ncbi:hypothetical protein Tco_0404031 [Tanacetum coccineum]
MVANSGTPPLTAIIDRWSTGGPTVVNGGAPPLTAVIDCYWPPLTAAVDLLRLDELQVDMWHMAAVKGSVRGAGGQISVQGSGRAGKDWLNNQTIIQCKRSIIPLDLELLLVGYL